MTSHVDRAVIILTPPEGGWRWLLDKPLAGVPALQRLVFTMGRAGIEKILILSEDLDAHRRLKLQENFAADPRSRAEVLIQDRYQEGEVGEFLQLDEAMDSAPILLAPGNLVTTTASLRKFLGKNSFSEPDGNSGDDEYSLPALIASSKLKRVKADKMVFSKEPLPAISRPGAKGESFFRLVEDHRQFRRLESDLIHQHRHHYSQLLDVYFNVHFSLPISSLLIRLPVTPNQVTIFGLVIGAAAGWLFSLGDYMSGLVGGVLLAFTAIWDCCDGDVARMKFMESDFGETLDTACDNIINIFIFLGLAFGVAKVHGWGYALLPFALLALGGLSIFALIYFPEGGKGDFFKGTKIFDVIELLASRNFIYIILGFSVFGRLDWFLWLAGFGSLIFALILFYEKQRIQKTRSVKPVENGRA
ncbi:MAG: CDP-alcohol phosphatidyltransferase family protein [Candidatus Nitronauta litoralis]|uniref:CDP-alcohol phosphatidyltransferase family protein n=1 Tax=Candidatus Nitronauta litoralis TaxID=2705533 RepID=A0A7T0BTV1_9BACT|nr:MAG: CDP-alcohol phosphatidyltransferase family protein [Candidatus Nitronauta litoralis]